MSRRLATALAAGTLALLTLLGLATPAAAAVSTQQKLSVLSSWTQTSASSYNAWNSARLNKTPWAEYGFDWSTDYCSSSPDNPLGFTFNLSCYRHDFGYRNHKAMGIFPANKSRLDSAFYADLKRVCATYNSVVRPACYSLAWTYYQAVSIFGSVAAVQQADLDRAARMKADAERRAAVRG
ncbi:phospholipase [Micromonospora sp. WMMA2032]|uniref:Phospholipase A2 n=1 Tax=Micromonospora sediminicola TaxID=946078 RepID=A0A1A9B509_9ACTN|nr:MULTISPECIES: phospholipase [Micromonospora]ATO16273.1 phospholipase [Micromonospora sp. WMMA2032]PGH41443.1 phospholipase [Micromonospora sp. WMMA1996]SBT64146.1 phospholipase A2 [Micromonospora sediminicola]